MKKILTVLLVMVVLGTVFTGAVFAQGTQSKMGAANNQPRYNADQRNYGVGYNRVELSQEQINEIADLKNDFYNKTEELRDQLRDLNHELRDLEFRGASNAEIGEVEDRIEEILVQMDEQRAANQKNIAEVLTEEQLNLIEENRLNNEERFQGRYNNEFGPHSNRSYGRKGYSRFDDNFRQGMLERNFSGNRNEGFRSGRNYNDRDFGYRAGWCH